MRNLTIGLTIINLMLFVLLAYNAIEMTEARENIYKEVNMLWNDDWESIPKTGDTISVVIDWESERTVIITQIK